jgi:hypothetical protein
MKILFFLTGLLILIPFLKTNAFQENNYPQINNSINKLEIISKVEMVKMVGGCGGGGTCAYVFHSCDIGCTSHSVKTCNSGSGNCSNSVYSVSCVCTAYYNVIVGCL